MASSVPVTARQMTNLHTEGATSGPIVESPEALQVTNVILCSCGGCVNETLHQCTCGVAAGERRKVAEALAAGATPESLIAAYIAEHGPKVRVVPERRGMHLLGWAVPFAAAGIGLATLTAVLLTWRRRSAAPLPGGGARPGGEADRVYRERILRDLENAE
jgi:cytochrome c-type biogenesis protein CcmH/NrfF